MMSFSCCGDAKNSFPFKGKAGKGMGVGQCFDKTHPHLNPPLEGEEMQQKF
jgi:hypothetical protein